MLIQDDRPARPPIYRYSPPVLLVLTGVIIAVSLFQMLASPAIVQVMLGTGALVDLGHFPGTQQKLGPYASYVLHVFLHGGLIHLAMNMWVLISLGTVIALAMGKTSRGGLAFLAFFFVCAIGGALAQVALFEVQAEGGYAVGASSAISGLLPAYGFLQGGWKRAIRISIPWLVINLALALFGGLSPIAIAWAAHLGGLAAGFTFPVFLNWARDQGSWRLKR